MPKKNPAGTQKLGVSHNDECRQGTDRVQAGFAVISLDFSAYIFIVGALAGIYTTRIASKSCTLILKQTIPMIGVYDL